MNPHNLEMGVTMQKLLGRSMLITFMLLAAIPLAAADDDADRRRRRTPIVEVFESTKDAVVNISTTRIVQMRSLSYGGLLEDIFDLPIRRPRKREVLNSIGSGVIVHESGYVVTNHHVISQASDVRVTFADKHTLPADVVAVDREHDLAVLKIKTNEPLPYQELGRSDDLMVGETVVAIGNPLGYQHSVSAGIISAIGRELQFDNNVAYKGLIQTDAPINPGNSGGPLLNINGELIGINTAIRGDAQNIGFSIPVDTLWTLLPAMLDIERRQRVRFGLVVGGPDATVHSVRDNTPAAEANLRPGDHIIEFNGEPLRDGIDYYVHLLTQRPNSEVRLAVQRGRTKVHVTIPLESIPIPNGARLANELFGLSIEEISDEDRRRYELPAYVGLIVTGVETGKAADRVGIRPADVILRVERVPVVTLQDLGLALEQAKAGEHVTVEGLRIDARHPFFWTATLRAGERL